MIPRAYKFRQTSTRLIVIFRVNVKERDFLHLGTVFFVRDGGDVEDAETGAVVGLVGEAVVDVLVVVDGADAGFVETCVDWLF